MENGIERVPKPRLINRDIRLITNGHTQTVTQEVLDNADRICSGSETGSTAKSNLSRRGARSQWLTRPVLFRDCLHIQEARRKLIR